jgi:hypothetical protein
MLLKLIDAGGFDDQCVANAAQPRYSAGAVFAFLGRSPGSQHSHCVASGTRRKIARRHDPTYQLWFTRPLKLSGSRSRSSPAPWCWSRSVDRARCCSTPRPVSAETLGGVRVGPQRHHHRDYYRPGYRSYGYYRADRGMAHRHDPARRRVNRPETADDGAWRRPA